LQGIHIGFGQEALPKNTVNQSQTFVRKGSQRAYEITGLTGKAKIKVVFWMGR